MDKKTQFEIEKVTESVLKDVGIIQPPVRIEDVLRHLHLHRQFYDLENPSFLDRTKHKIRVNGIKIVNIIRKIKLKAVLFYDESRILIDKSLPEIKQDWPSFHESAHKILPWHRPYFYGDTAQTLDPDWHEILESEANYAASNLMFCGQLFTREACDTEKAWMSIETLAKRYEKTLTTTLRRYVERSHDHPMLMMVSTPYWIIKPQVQQNRCRYFVGSDQFNQRFSNVKREQILAILDRNIEMRRGGPVADFCFMIEDDNCEQHEFHAESFYNTHDVLTFCVHIKKRTSKCIITT